MKLLMRSVYTDLFQLSQFTPFIQINNTLHTSKQDCEKVNLNNLID